MKVYEETKNITCTSERMGVDRKTVRKYVKVAEGRIGMPQSQERRYRTRKDPFEHDWPWLKGMLQEHPELEAKTLFQELQRRSPTRYASGQLRTLQRRVREFRAKQGPEQEVFFEQRHRPAERIETDFTDGTKLDVRIDGEPFSHLLCHVVLPYSNASMASVSQSESLMALHRGVQRALQHFGGVPLKSQTDNSTSATHAVHRYKGRRFNDAYLEFCAHYGMEPVAIEVGKKEQNGDVESAHRSLKSALKQALMLRGNRDFPTVAEYEAFVKEMCTRRNEHRGSKVAEERSTLRPLPLRAFAEYRSYGAYVSKYSTVRILANSYSVPSRLIGHRVDVRLFEYEIEVYYRGERQMRCARLVGKYKAHIDYRHVVWSLLGKPGAFERYAHREQMFPSVHFRKAYDVLLDTLGQRQGTLEYLRILHLAASGSQTQVQAQLESRLGKPKTLRFDELKLELGQTPEKTLPALEPVRVDLKSYDALLKGAWS